MWMRKERIAFCSLTTAWTEAGLHTGRHQSSAPRVVWFNIISVQWVVSLAKQNINRLALQPRTLWISKLLYMKRSFGNISSCIPWEKSGQLLQWWPRKGEMRGFLIGSRQNREAGLKLWGVGENEQSGHVRGACSKRDKYPVGSSVTGKISWKAPRIRGQHLLDGIKFHVGSIPLSSRKRRRRLTLVDFHVASTHSMCFLLRWILTENSAFYSEPKSNDHYIEWEKASRRNSISRQKKSPQACSVRQWIEDNIGYLTGEEELCL